MWQPIVDKLQRQSESERLAQAEKYIKELKEVIVELGERVEKLETKNETI